MKVIRKEKSLIPFCELIVFEAQEDQSASFGTFMGDKTFWVNKGDRARIRVKKSDCLEVGDEINFAWIVRRNQDAFTWNWN